MEPIVIDHPELEMLRCRHAGQPPSDANRPHERGRALAPGDPIATHPDEIATPHGGLHGVLGRPSPMEVVAVGDSAACRDEPHKFHPLSITDAAPQFRPRALRSGHGDAP